MGARIGLAVVALAALLLYISNREVPEDVAGRPEISVEFPAASAPGSTQTATFTIRNPGESEMGSIFISFARVGPAQGGGEIPAPIVDPGAKHSNPAIVSISPEPVATSIDAVVFRFGGLEPGGSMTVTFELIVPETTGPAANSVSAYPGEDPESAKGVRLETQVGG